MHGWVLSFSAELLPDGSAETRILWANPHFEEMKSDTKLKYLSRISLLIPFCSGRGNELVSFFYPISLERIAVSRSYYSKHYLVSVKRGKGDKGSDFCLLTWKYRKEKENVRINWIKIFQCKIQPNFIFSLIGSKVMSIGASYSTLQSPKTLYGSHIQNIWDILQLWTFIPRTVRYFKFKIDYTESPIWWTHLTVRPQFDLHRVTLLLLLPYFSHNSLNNASPSLNVV